MSYGYVILSYVMSYVMVTTYPNRKGICHGICHGVTLKSLYVMRYVIAASAYVIRDCHVYMSFNMSWCHIEVGICHAIYHVVWSYVVGDCHVYMPCLYVMLYGHMSLGINVMCICHVYMSQWCKDMSLGLSCVYVMFI